MSTDKPHRKQIRVRGYDYSLAGAYFITICTHQRLPLFGQLIRDKMTPSPLGHFVVQHLRQMGDHYPFVEVDSHVVMPNHLHAILLINEDSRKSLARIVAAFKASVFSAAVKAALWDRGNSLWQRNYFEHI